MMSLLALARPFLDWYGIWASHRKEERDGSVWSQDPPLGIALTIEPARASAIFLVPERPWEEGAQLSLHAVLRESGRYRLWYSASRAGEEGHAFVCYAESDDGFAWSRPALGLVEYGGSRQNNILCRSGDHPLGAVFRDPAAPPSERYKAIEARGRYLRDGRPDPTLDKARFKELVAAMELEGVTPEQRRRRLEVHQALHAAVSPDGIRWRDLEEPILDVGATQLDTHNLCSYDPLAGRYVAYLRGHLERRRLVRRAEGAEFRRLEPPRPCLAADPQDPVDDDIYNPCYSPYPERPLHLMFPSFYHRITSTVDVQLATSRDGCLWTRPERRPIIGRAYDGGEYGTVYACPELVVHGGGEWRLAYMGSHRRHDFLDRGAAYPIGSEYRWACWEEDRLVGLEAAAEGRVTLVQRACAGRDLRLNYRTRADGWIRAELVNAPDTPPRPVEALPGFAADACEPLTGDQRSRPVTWAGRADLSALAGREISVRLHLCRAKIYSVAL